MAGSGRFSRQNFIRGMSYLRRNGWKHAFFKVAERFVRDAGEKDYDAWFKAHRPGEQELEKQKRDRQLNPGKISILVPAYETPEPFFLAMLRSVLAQTYPNWELCIADGSRSGRVKEMTQALLIREVQAGEEAGAGERIRYLRLGENRGIAENTNAALAMATGDYICLLDHDDALREDALYEAALALHAGAEAAYTDEDKIDEAGGRHFDYHRKPDFNKDLLLSNNYICHLFVVKKEIADKAGGFRPGYDGAQDYDFILRCADEIQRSGGKISHVPGALYHWRSHEASTAENPESKMYAYEAGKRAVRDYLKRAGIEAAVSHTRHLGFYRVVYRLKPEQAKEDILISVASSLTPLTPGWEEEMRGYFCRPEVAVVGGKIYDRKRRIRCAGYGKDEEGRIVSHFAGMKGYYSGYLHRAVLQQDVEAVDLDCMMVRKSVFDEIGGTLPETGTTGLQASYEFCRRVREAGYLVVFDPYAEFRRA